MPRLCRCGAIVEAKCPKCDKNSKKTAEYGYDNKWRKLSERKRAIDPLCEMCEKEGRVTPAVEVHHIQPVSSHPGLRLEWSNLMSICVPCHEKLDRGWQAHE